MIQISLCMIVKNEEAVLARCLDSIKDLMDEIIIVDTGSTDRTKEIAAGYTDQIYDFAWVDDFAAARNFAFSKASMPYIYTADADEVVSEENRQRFLQLKEVLLPEIDIVQMKYGNQLEHGTAYNYDEEYDDFVCEMDLDEDEMARFLSSQAGDCPYWRPGDDYRTARRQAP